MMKNIKQTMPVIKWTGSKRKLAKNIVSHFPFNINTYYEPFLGGGSVFFYLLKSSSIKVKSYNISDINKTLIEVFYLIKDRPNELINSYRYHWDNLSKIDDYYYIQRDVFNKTGDPFIFYFLNRTCYNGTIRYNKKNEFNTSFHFDRNGIKPERLKDIIEYYSSLMKNKDIILSSSSYKEVIPQSNNDIVFIDPPYVNSKTLYYGDISINDLLEWLHNLNCSWFMTYNTNLSKRELSIDCTKKVELFSGNSSFRKLKGKNVEIIENLYINLKI